MTSDLTLLAEFGTGLAPAQDHPPAAVRHRVMTGLQRPVRRPRLPAGLRGVRLAWQVGVPAVVTTAAVAALLAAQLSGIADGPQAPPGRAGGVEAGTGAAGPQDPPTARQVLRLAAQHVAATPALVVRPDQFLFIDTVEVEMKRSAGRTGDSGPLHTGTWLSVDGTRDGLVIQQAAPSSRRTVRTHLDGCTNGRQAETVDRPETTPTVACTPEPAYRPGRIPTDPARLLAYVRAAATAEPEWVSIGRGTDGRPRGFVRLSVDQSAFHELADILFRNHLPAVQQAAFQAAGRLAGVQVRRGVTDAAGRRGIAVTRSEGGSRQELVFDPTTYRYLGQNVIGAELDLHGAKVVRWPTGQGSSQIWAGPNPKPGDVIYKSALLRIAVVDRSGQRP